eukprot:UN05007
MRKEYTRLLGDKSNAKYSNFRISEVNIKYELCPTYPAVLCIPKKVQDKQLSSVADFRSSRRLPSVVWISKAGNVSIARSSQPRSGGWGRSEHDENFIKALRMANDSNKGKRYVIVDCRPSLNAQVNRLQGKGFEKAQNYENCHLDFYDIENIHKMRTSLAALKSLLEKDEDSQWLSKLEATKWLYHLKHVLACALRVVTIVKDDQCSCLIHCSDGWDRTSQVCGLAELLLDSYFRTFHGFLILIQKEWLWFAHKFASRSGLYALEGTPVKNEMNVHQCFYSFWIVCIK